MTLTELAQLVAAMRDAQKRYFKTRSPQALESSKLMESTVDRAVEAILYGPGLFPEEGR